MSTKILITGSAGYIGSRLISELIKGDHDIIGLDRLRSQRPSSNPDPHLRFFETDIADISTIPAATTSEANILVHAAALVHRASQDLSRENYFRVNHLGTKNILASLDPASLEHIIFLSTVSVYGKAAKQHTPDENTSPLPVDFYGESKLAAENEIIAFCDSSKIPYTILRMVPVYGPDFLVNLNKRILLPKKIGFYRISTGKQKISLCSIGNVTRALSQCMNNPVCFNETFIVKDGEDYSLEEIILFYKKHLGYKHTPVIRIPEIFPKLFIKGTMHLLPPEGS